MAHYLEDLIMASDGNLSSVIAKASSLFYFAE